MYNAARPVLFSFLWPTLVVLALSTSSNQPTPITQQSPAGGFRASQNPPPPVNSTGASSSSAYALEPASPSQRAQVMVELEEVPAAEVYAREKSLNYPLGEAASESLAGGAAQRQLRANETAQQRLLRALGDPAIEALVLYRVQRVYNGIALEVDSSKLKQIAELPGVKSVHPLPLAAPARSFSVPFIGAPGLWSGSGLSVTGRDIKVGIIDSGIDYLHNDFGGTGVYAGQVYSDAVVPWTAKVVGGYDFAGDDYDSGSTDSAKRVPRPDPDPMDCGGHGTSVAGIVAGYGIRRDGSTYSGPFDASINYSALSIGPGVAPEAKLYALKVGGCQGSSRLIAQAIEWAADPNGDGDFSDHLDVLNISMGSPWGSVDDPQARALENAALVGVLSATSAGNNGDTYYIVGSPSVASRTISVAGSETGNAFVDGFRINAPASLQGVYPSTNSANFNWQSLTAPPSGNLVYPAGEGQNSGCAAFSSSNAARLNGNIAMLDYTGGCGTSVSVGNASQAGARGVLLIHTLPNWIGIAGNNQIPATRTSQEVGNLIKQALAAGATVNITLTTEYDSTHKIEDKSRLDMVVDYSSRGPRVGDSFLKPDITAPTEHVQTAKAKSGSGATGFNGTSSSAPLIAGGLALMRQLRPGWTVEEIKAALMNTAIHDLFSKPSLTSPRYSPARVGAGRVDLAKAAETAILAFNADDPGMVSVSFGAPEVTNTLVLEKSVRVVNKGQTPASFTIGYDGISDVPGVGFSFPGGSTLEAGAGGYRIVEIAPGQSKVFTVRMTADAAQMKHSRDTTVSATQAGYARHWISEEAGYITLSPLNGQQLRIPVYAAPRPASAMRATLDQITLAAPTGTISIPLAGQGVNTGNSPPTDVVSLVAAFELQESSPDDAYSTGLLQSLDLKSIGVRSNFKAMAAQGKGMADTMLFFALSSYQDWSTQTPYYFYVYLDVNRDGIDDYYLYNGGYATTGDGAADAPYSKLCPAAGGNCKFEGWLNYYDASQRETAVFNTNIMWFMVKAADLG